jgi:hypothetical protein
MHEDRRRSYIFFLLINVSIKNFFLNTGLTSFPTKQIQSNFTVIEKFIKFVVVKEASRISYHEWQQYRKINDLSIVILG